MQMRPIVNGLKTEFDGQVVFRVENALDDGAGEAAFASLGLPGHPSFLVFDPAGKEVFRTFGIVEVEQLREAINTALTGKDD